MRIRIAGLLLALAGLIVNSSGASAQSQATAPPVPVPSPTASGIAVPLPTPAPRGRRGGLQSTPAPSASGTAAPSGPPAPPQFTTLDGVWEVEVQTRATTFYSHLQLKQSGDAGADVGGLWDWGGKPDKKVPVRGSFDGRLFKFTANDGDTEWTFTGYIENYTDIVGMLSNGKSKTSTPFTAQHRKKEKLINSINPGLP